MSDNITIKNIKPKIQYRADGTTNIYSFPFNIFKPENVTVYFGSVKQTEGYTVSLGENDDGGTVCFDTIPEKDTIITIVRRMVIERTSDFQAGGAIRAEELNYELDYQTACTQQLSDDLSRSMILPPYFVGDDIDFTMPEPLPGKCIVWAKDGKTLENSTIELNSITAELENDRKVASASATIATDQANLAKQYAEALADIKQQCEDIVANLDTSGSGSSSDSAMNNILTNCIIYDPNPAVTFTDTTITIHSGLKVLIPNGLNADGSFNNITYTVENDMVNTVPIFEDPESTYFGFNSNGEFLSGFHYFICEDNDIALDTYYAERFFNPKTNKTYYHAKGATAWTEETGVFVIGYYGSGYNKVDQIRVKSKVELQTADNTYDLRAKKTYENANGEEINLDFYLTPGIYCFCSSGNMANLPYELTDEPGGMLMVIGNHNLLKQIWFKMHVKTSKDYDVFERSFFRGSADWAWNDWKKIYKL